MADLAISQPPILPRGERRAIGLITVAHGFSHFYQILIPSLFVFIAESLRLSYTQLGVLITLFFLASGVGQVLSGFAVDRLGGRRLLLGGMALIAGAHFAAGFSNSFAMLAVCAFLAGAGNSVFHPADFSLLNHIAKGPRLAWAFSAHGIGGNVGYVLSPTFAVAAATAFGWQHALMVAGGLGLALWVWLAFDPDIRVADQGHLKSVRADALAQAEPEALFRPLMKPVIFSAFCFFCVTTFYSTAISSFGPAIFRDYHGLAKAPATLLLTVYLIAQTVGMLLGGWLLASGRAPGNTAATATLTAAALACGLWFAPPSFLVLACLLAGIGLASGAVGPSRDMLVKRAAPKNALGRAYGIVYAGFDVGSTLVPIAYGWLIDRSLAAVVIGFIVSAFLLNTWLARRLDRGSAAQQPD